jgi:hypothetical protein
VNEKENQIKGLQEECDLSKKTFQELKLSNERILTEERAQRQVPLQLTLPQIRSFF